MLKNFAQTLTGLQLRIEARLRRRRRPARRGVRLRSHAGIGLRRRQAAQRGSAHVRRQRPPLIIAA